MAKRVKSSRPAGYDLELMGKTVETAGRVIVPVSGSPCSVAALLWVIAHVRHPVVLFEREACRPKVTESYVRAVAHAFGLTLETSLARAVRGTRGQLVLVVGARYGEAAEQHAPNSQIVLRPMTGRTEDEVLAELDTVGVRPHPALTLGLSEVCSEEELVAGARAATGSGNTSLEVALAAAAVEAGEFPLGSALFEKGEKRERFDPRAPTVSAQDFEGEPVAEPASSVALGPDLGLDTLRVNGYPVPLAWPLAGEASREKGKRWLFSYGSNSPKRLAERLGHKVTCAPAVAYDRERTYVGHSKTWGGAVATLVPVHGGRVEGGACLVSEADLKALDVHEGVPTKYRRQTVAVTLHPSSATKSRKVVALAYLAAPGNQKLGAPTIPYLQAVLDNLNAHGFKVESPAHMDPFARDAKGKPQILYPSGVTPFPTGDGENNAERWLRLSPAAQRARLAWEKASGISDHATIAEREKQLEATFGKKRWAKYKADLAKATES